MDQNETLIARIIEHLLEEGIIVLSATAVGGFTLGPAGLAIGAAAGGGLATGIAMHPNSRFRRYATAFTTFLMSLVPGLWNRYVQDFLRNLADLIAKLLRKIGVLPTSEVHDAIQRRDPRDGPGPPPAAC